jgi:hypothetical protein
MRTSGWRCLLFAIVGLTLHAEGALAAGRTINANPSTYLGLISTLQPGDTLVLAAGNYAANGLPVADLNGTSSEPITITGPVGPPRAVILGSSGQDTVRISRSSYVVIKNLDVDSQNLGVDGVNSRTSNHHITIEGLSIRGCSDARGTVGISTNQAPVWDWVIRGNTITDCGTGMYLGNSDGNQQFLRGIIENNLIYDTLGYNIEIKQQNPLPSSVSGLPLTTTKTIVRNNVFSKANNAETGDGARPLLLVGHVPLTGPGVDNYYEIYGNFFYQNPTGEPLFQGEGNFALYNNLFFNSIDPADASAAILVQPHNDRPRDIRIFNNTIVSRNRGITVTGGYTAFRQQVIGNAVFAASPISASDQQDNITDTYSNAVNYLANPFASLGAKDFFPIAGKLSGAGMATSTYNLYSDWDKDFNNTQRTNFTFRGAYFGEGTNPGWLPRLAIKPLASAPLSPPSAPINLSVE